MKFANIKKRMDSFFDGSPETQFFTKEELEILKKGFELISHDIHRMIDGENLEHNDETYLVIIDCVVILSNRALDAPMSDGLVEILASFSELTYNWNENLSKDSVIRQLCLHISRLSETRNVIVNSINVMKHVDDRLALISNWAPPAYEISKSYFEELLKENEKKKV